MSKSNYNKIKEVESCPECGKTGTIKPPPKEEDKILLITFKCPEGHIFQKKIDLK